MLFQITQALETVSLLNILVHGYFSLGQLKSALRFVEKIDVVTSSLRRFFCAYPISDRKAFFRNPIERLAQHKSHALLRTGAPLTPHR